MNLRNNINVLFIVLATIILDFDNNSVHAFSIVTTNNPASGRTKTLSLPQTPLKLRCNTIQSQLFASGLEEPEMETKKETTWDRITGPKLFKTVTNWQGIHAVPLVPLRIMTGLLMIHHGSEGGLGPANFGTPEFQGFVDFIMKPYFSFLPGSPELWAAIHDYAEFFGGGLFVIGFLTRPAALSLLVTMLSAVYFHLCASGTQGFPLGHVSNYSYDFEEPTLYALIFLMFWFNGAGPLSIDSIIYGQISQEEEK